VVVDDTVTVGDSVCCTVAVWYGCWCAVVIVRFVDTVGCIVNGVAVIADINTLLDVAVDIRVTVGYDIGAVAVDDCCCCWCY